MLPEGNIMLEQCWCFPARHLLYCRRREGLQLIPLAVLLLAIYRIQCALHDIVSARLLQPQVLPSVSGAGAEVALLLPTCR